MAEPFHATFSVPVAAPSLIVEAIVVSLLVIVPLIFVNVVRVVGEIDVV